MNKQLLLILLLAFAVMSGRTAAFPSDAFVVYANDEIDPTTITTTTTTTTSSDGTTTDASTTTTTIDTTTDTNTTDTTTSDTQTTDAAATDVVDAEEITTTDDDGLSGAESDTSAAEITDADNATGSEHVLDDTPQTNDGIVDPKYAFCGGLFLFGLSLIFFSKKKEQAEKK